MKKYGLRFIFWSIKCFFFENLFQQSVVVKSDKFFTEMNKWIRFHTLRIILVFIKHCESFLQLFIPINCDIAHSAAKVLNKQLSYDLFPAVPFVHMHPANQLWL